MILRNLGAAVLAFSLMGCMKFIAEPAPTPEEQANIQQQFALAHMACCSRLSAAEKLALYCRAAHAGQPEAQEHLGRIYSGTYESPYFKGLKIQTDYPLALMWITVAMEHNHPDPTTLETLRHQTLAHMDGGDVAYASALKQRWQTVPCGTQTE